MRGTFGTKKAKKTCKAWVNPWIVRATRFPEGGKESWCHHFTLLHDPKAIQQGWAGVYKIKAAWKRSSGSGESTCICFRCRLLCHWWGASLESEWKVDNGFRHNKYDSRWIKHFIVGDLKGMLTCNMSSILLNGKKKSILFPEKIKLSSFLTHLYKLRIIKFINQLLYSK